MNVRFGINALPNTEYLHNKIDNMLQSTTKNIVITCIDFYTRTVEDQKNCIDKFLYDLQQNHSFIEFENILKFHHSLSKHYNKKFSNTKRKKLYNLRQGKEKNQDVSTLQINEEVNRPTTNNRIPPTEAIDTADLACTQNDVIPKSSQRQSSEEYSSPSTHADEVQHCTETSHNLHSLLVDNNLQKVNMAPDGDCLFSSIVFNFPTYTTSTLRQEVCTHIRNHHSTYRAFLSCNDSEFDNELVNLQKKGHWNSNICDLLPYALSNLLQRNIIIYSSDNQFPIKYISPDLCVASGEDILISHSTNYGSEHYDALIPFENNNHTNLNQPGYNNNDISNTKQNSINDQPTTPINSNSKINAGKRKCRRFKRRIQGCVT